MQRTMADNKWHLNQLFRKWTTELNWTELLEAIPLQSRHEMYYQHDEEAAVFLQARAMLFTQDEAGHFERLL